jgi:hypothetical protein
MMMMGRVMTVVVMVMVMVVVMEMGMMMVVSEAVMSLSRIHVGGVGLEWFLCIMLSTSRTHVRYGREG